MTTHTAAAATGLPEYDDDRVLHDLKILRQHLAVAGNTCLDIESKDAQPHQVFALIETAGIYVDHMRRSLTAAAYPSSEAQS